MCEHIFVFIKHVSHAPMAGKQLYWCFLCGAIKADTILEDKVVASGIIYPSAQITEHEKR